MTRARSRQAGIGLTCLLLFVAILWAQPLLTLSLGHQNDIPVHLRWSEQFLTAVREGWILPRWAYASRLGMGDPTFFYYQPLFYYFSAAFAFLGFGAEQALLMAAAVPYVLLGAVVYFYVLRAYPNRHAVLGSLFVVGCPLLFFLSVYMAAFPWTLSLPFSVLFIVESTRNRPRPVPLAALLCLVCLSHLLSGLMTLLCTGLGRLCFAFPSRRHVTGTLNWALGIVLGLGLAAFFIYPAVTQLHLITPTGWTHGNGFDWHKCFAFPTFTAKLYTMHWFGIQWPLALMALAMAVLGVLQGRGDRATPALVGARRMAIVALAALALGSELAYPLYATLSPMQKIQFPYRFIFLACILGNISFVVALCEGAWARWGRRMRTLAVLLIAAQCAQLALIQWGLHTGGERLLAREQFMRGNFGQPEYVPAVARPQWKDYANDGKLPGECERLGIRCEAIRQRSHDLSVTVTTDRAVSLRLPLFAFPAWRASVDGVTQDYATDKETGLLLVQVPAGTHAVTLRWSRLPAETTGLWISAGALCILLGGLVFSSYRRTTVAQPVLSSSP